MNILCKSIAPKAVKEETNHSSYEEPIDDEELVMFVRRFRHFFKPKKGNYRRKTGHLRG
jgi:hypothetical protein